MSITYVTTTQAPVARRPSMWDKLKSFKFGDDKHDAMPTVVAILPTPMYDDDDRVDSPITVDGRKRSNYFGGAKPRKTSDTPSDHSHGHRRGSLFSSSNPDEDFSSPAWGNRDDPRKMSQLSHASSYADSEQTGCSSRRSSYTPRNAAGSFMRTATPLNEDPRMVEAGITPTPRRGSNARGSISDAGGRRSASLSAQGGILGRSSISSISMQGGVSGRGSMGAQGGRGSNGRSSISGPTSVSVLVSESGQMEATPSPASAVVAAAGGRRASYVPKSAVNCFMQSASPQGAGAKPMSRNSPQLTEAQQLINAAELKMPKDKDSDALKKAEAAKRAKKRDMRDALERHQMQSLAGIADIDESCITPYNESTVNVFAPTFASYSMVQPPKYSTIVPPRALSTFSSSSTLVDDSRADLQKLRSLSLDDLDFKGAQVSVV